MSDILEQINNDPKFQQLDYENQTAVRARLLVDQFSQDPNFVGLHPQVQQRVIRKAATQPPAFKNPQFAQYANEQIAKKKAGERDDFSSFLTRFGGALSLAKYGSKVAKEAFPGIEDSNLTWEALFGDDAQKLQSYMSAVDPSEAWAGAAGNIAGMITDIVSYNLLASPINRTTAAIGEARAATIGGKSVRGKRWLNRVAVPQLSESSLEGAFGVFRERTLDTGNADDLKGIAKTFGFYALEDYVTGAAMMTAFPFFRTSFGKIFGKRGKRTAKGARAYTDDVINQSEWDDLVRQVEEGEITPARLEQMDSVTQDALLGRVQVKNIVREGVLDDINNFPGEYGQFTAHNLGVLSRKFDDGRYRITEITDDGYKQTEFNNAYEMNNRLSEIAEQQLETLGTKTVKGTKVLTDEAAAFEETYRPILMYNRMKKGVDYTYDPVFDPTVDDAFKSSIKSTRSKSFVSPVKRPYLSSIEAEDIRKRNVYSGYVDHEVDATNIESIKKGKLFETDDPRSFQISDKGRVFYSFNNPAVGDEYQAALELVRKAKAAGSPESESRLLAKFLVEGGYDGAITGNGTIFAPFPNKMKVIADNVDPATGRSIKVNPKSEARKTRAIIEDTVSAKVSKETFAGSKRAMAESLSKIKGDVDPEYVRKLSKGYLEGTGSNISDVRVRTGSDIKKVSMYESDGTLTVAFPKKIDNYKIQRQVSDELVEGLNRYTGNRGGVKGISEVLSKSPSKYDLPFNEVTKRKWLMSIAREDFQATAKVVNNRISLRMPDGTTQVFNSSDELGQYLMSRSIDESTLSKLLAEDGYRMAGKRGDYKVFDKNGLVVRGENAQEIMQRMGWRPERIPNNFAPKNIVIGDGNVTFDFDRSTAYGTRKSLLETLDKFADYRNDALYKTMNTNKDGIIQKNHIGKYRVKIPDAGIIEYFDNIKDAKSFLNKNLKDFDSFKEQALKKGLLVSDIKSSITLTDGKYRYTAKNLDEARQILKAYPDPDGAQSILTNVRDGGQIEEAVSSYVGKEYKTPKPLPKGKNPPDIYTEEASPMESLGFMWNMKKYFARTAEVMESGARKTGDDTSIRLYRETETMRRYSDADINRTGNAILQALKGDSGKTLSEAQLRKLYYFGGAQSESELAAAKATFGELTGEESRALERIRDILGRDEYSGLYYKFNIGGSKVNGSNFIFNYLPRIRSWMNEADNKLLAQMTEADEVAQAAFKGNVPKEVKFWAENSRASELLDMAVEDNIFKVLQRYNYQGHRKLYLNPTIKKWNNYMKEAAPPGDFRWAMTSYLERLQGSTKMIDEKAAEQIGRSIYWSLGFRDPKSLKEGANLYKKLFTLNYAVNMTWRPWLSVRNSYQIWTTLAGRWGNSNVSKAIRALDDGSEDIYNYLKDAGIISDKPPILNQIEGGEGLLEKFTEKGLNWFKNSDEFTRAVAYLTAKNQMDEALDAWNKGVIKSEDEFAEIAGLNKSADDVRKTVLNYVRRGDDDSIQAAYEQYGNYVVEETMFGYRPSESPSIHRGFIGKLFGQYGTFSAGYRANIVHGIRHGSFKDKASFLGRFTANQLALWGGFTALGIQADDFIPFAPSIFTGGPLFDATIDFLRAADPSSYEGAESRRRLQRLFSPVVVTSSDVRLNYPGMVPGSLQFRYLQKAYKYLEEGDYWKMFLSLTATPTVQSDGQ